MQLGFEAFRGLKGDWRDDTAAAYYGIKQGEGCPEESCASRCKSKAAGGGGLRRPAAAVLLGLLVVWSGCARGREARRDVETFARTVSPRSDKDSVRASVKNLQHAWLIEDTPEHWRLLTPDEFGASNWVAAIVFGPDGRLRSIRYGTVDSLGTKYRVEGVPQDQCFDSNGCLGP